MHACDMKIVHEEMMDTLGKGPMRFGPVRTPVNVKERLLQSEADLAAFVHLNVAAEDSGCHADQSFSAEQILRVAIFHDFHVGKATRLLKRMDARYWNVSVAQLKDQLETQTLFPLPRKLKSKDGEIDAFFYMKPSRFVPSQTKTSAIIANLLYVMDSMDHYSGEKSRSSHKKKTTKKLGFIANMNDWTMEHFSVDYCLQFMEALQGWKGPVRVDMFLIVNPPAWFGKVWKIMKPMLSPGFRNKVHMIQQEKLGDYLALGYTRHLPEEFAQGQVDAGELVQDFIRYRTYVETHVFPAERNPCKATADLVRPKGSSTQVKRRSSVASSSAGSSSQP